MNKLSYLPAFETALVCCLWIGVFYLFHLGLSKLSAIPDMNIDKPITSSSSTFSKPKIVKIKKLRR